MRWNLRQTGPLDAVRWFKSSVFGGERAPPRPEEADPAGVPLGKLGLLGSRQGKTKQPLHQQPGSAGGAGSSSSRNANRACAFELFPFTPVEGKSYLGNRPLFSRRSQNFPLRFPCRFN